MIDLQTRYERACSKSQDGRAFDALSRRDQILIVICQLEADVNNGGFDQYYFNSAGNLAFFAPEACEAIGAWNMAAIVREANRTFGENGPARDRPTRQAQLMRLTAADEDLFAPLDERFWSYPDDLAVLLTAFLEAAPEGN